MMAKWPEIPDASAEVERLRVELEQARAERDLFRDSVARQSGARVMAERRALAAEQAAEQAKAERDDLAARLQSIQQAERTYTAAKLHEAARMRKGEAL